METGEDEVGSQEVSRRSSCILEDKSAEPSLPRGTDSQLESIQKVAWEKDWVRASGGPHPSRGALRQNTQPACLGKHSREFTQTLRDRSCRRKGERRAWRKPRAALRERAEGVSRAARVSRPPAEQREFLGWARGGGAGVNVRQRRVRLCVRGEGLKGQVTSSCRV